MFPYVYRAIAEMIENDPKATRFARAIARKAGFRPGSSAFTSAGAGPILTVPPVVVAGGCPRVPYGTVDTGDGTFALAEFFDGPGELEEFYDNVEAAEGGDTAAFVWLRDTLVDMGLEETIVMECVMDNLRYDYAGEVCTFTLNPDAACPIEFDIAPPSEGFWEQYAEGDARFIDKNCLMKTGNDYRVLVRSVELSTANVSQQFPYARTNLNQTAIVPYSTCPGLPGPEAYTHFFDGIQGPDTPKVFSIQGYRQNYGTTGTDFPTIPSIVVTNDALLDNEAHPFVENTGQGNGPNFGIMAGSPRTTLTGPTWADAGFFAVGREDSSIPFYVDTNWRPCADPNTTLEPLQESFAVMRSPQDSFDPDTDTDTYRSLRVSKEPPNGRQTHDWTTTTGVASTVSRYASSWPTFDIVAVRMTGRASPVAAGSYLFP